MNSRLALSVNFFDPFFSKPFDKPNLFFPDGGGGADELSDSFDALLARVDGGLFKSWDSLDIL